MNPEEKTRRVSRRELLWQGGLIAGAHLGALLIPSLGAEVLQATRLRGMARWYEIVQDMQDEGKWHVNLFAAPVIGELPRAQHLGRQVMTTEEVIALRRRGDYPARLQFRDGRREQDF